MLHCLKVGPTHGYSIRACDRKQNREREKKTIPYDDNNNVRVYTNVVGRHTRRVHTRIEIISRFINYIININTCIYLLCIAFSTRLVGLEQLVHDLSYGADTLLFVHVPFVVSVCVLRATQQNILNRNIQYFQLFFFLILLFFLSKNCAATKLYRCLKDEKLNERFVVYRLLKIVY